jgi:S1-C subfamily serine protease
MERGRSIKLVTSAIATLAIVIAVAVWYRAGPGEAASAVSAVPAVPADTPPRALGGPGPEGQASPAADSMEASATPGTGTAADGGSVVAQDADERQLAKITRGMSPAAAGGILVTATPPGSVTGQLHLHEGDVIVAVNGEAISSPEEFARIYREQGLPRQLTIVRDGREIHRH